MESLFSFIGSPGPAEMMIVGLIALLLFGNRLPKVMRSLGQGITEFKKGVQGIQDEIEESANRPLPPPDANKLS